MTAQDDDVVEIHLLGPLRVTYAGQPLAVGPARCRAVFATLAMAPGRNVSKDELIAAVWGDEPPASARGNLYTYVSALRRVLEPDRDRWSAGSVLASEGGNYCLRVPASAVDVGRFEALRERSRALRAGGDTAGELAALDAALAEWHGDEALAGIPGPRAEIQRARLGELRRATAERLAELRVEPERIPPRHTGFRGRAAAVAELRRAVAGLARGRGGSVWVGGAAGIGKSALLAEGLRDADGPGLQVGWGIGDELAHRTPLGVLRECLQLSGDPVVVPGGTLPTMAVIDAVRAFVAERCAQGPLLLVMDDLQWADDLSLLVWHALHKLTERLPLLLVSAARPLPATHEVRLLRRVLPRHGTVLIELEPLSDDTATELARSWARQPDPAPAAVRSSVAAAAGNPYYLRHLVQSRVDRPAADTPAPHLVDAVSRHLQPLTDDARELLRAIAFLGDNYLVGDLPAVTGKPLTALLPAVEEALAAGVLTGDGLRLRFRHPVTRQVLCGAVPTALRIMMHRQFAQRIAEAGGDPGRVAGQLLAGPVPVDAWVERWLTTHAEELSDAAPTSAIAVLRHAVAAPGLSAPARQLLTAHLARVLFRFDRPAEAEAGWVAARTGDARTRAEMSWIVAVGHQRHGRHQAALDLASASLHGPDLPRQWIDRYRTLVAQLTADRDCLVG